MTDTIITINSYTRPEPAAKAWGGGANRTVWHWSIARSDRSPADDNGKEFTSADQAATAAIDRLRELGG
jgi:hypothetical protein